MIPGHTSKGRLVVTEIKFTAVKKKNQLNIYLMIKKTVESDYIYCYALHKLYHKPVSLLHDHYHFNYLNISSFDIQIVWHRLYTCVLVERNTHKDTNELESPHHSLCLTRF